jgi:hypothetical protein
VVYLTGNNVVINSTGTTSMEATKLAGRTVLLGIGT